MRRVYVRCMMQLSKKETNMHEIIQISVTETIRFNYVR